MYFNIIGVKKIVRYVEDFVIWRFVISRFHYIRAKKFQRRRSLFFSDVFISVAVVQDIRLNFSRFLGNRVLIRDILRPI